MAWPEQAARERRAAAAKRAGFRMTQGNITGVGDWLSETAVTVAKRRYYETVALSSSNLRRNSGAKSAPFGQAMVRISGSTRTAANADGSRSGWKIGPVSC